MKNMAATEFSGSFIHIIGNKYILHMNLGLYHCLLK